MSSNNSNTRDAAIGFGIIAIIIIGVVAVVLYFIPSEPEPIPELETKNEVIIDSGYNQYNDIKSIIGFYTNVDKHFQIRYNQCSNVSSYGEFLEFVPVLGNTQEINDVINTNVKVQSTMTRLGLDNNIDILNAIKSATHTMSLYTTCSKELLNTYSESSINSCHLFCDSTGYEPQWVNTAVNVEDVLTTCVYDIPLDNSNDSLWCDEFYEYALGLK